MSCRWIAAALGVVVAYGSGAVAYAQPVCERLADRLQPDRLLQGSTESRFEALQSIVRDDQYAAWSTARDKRLDINLTVPRYMSGVLNERVEEDNWCDQRRKFLDLRWSEVAANRNAVLVVEQTSVAAARTVVDCARVFAERDRQGFFGVLASVSDRRDQFTIRLERIQRQGDPQTWGIRSIGPQQAGLRCDDDWHRASPTQPRTYAGLTLFLNCTKDENRAMDVTVVTSVGDAGPFRLASLGDELAEMRRLVARAEAAAAEAVPRGTVAFFNLASCPRPGWEPMPEARGRYVVGVMEGGGVGRTVGEALTEQENRATGAHTHTLTPDVRNIPIYDASRQGTGFAEGRGSGYVQTPFGTTRPIPVPAEGAHPGQAGRDVPGTNAPYIQLLVCRRT